MINSGRLHFVKAVTPGAELAEFALPPAFFERFLERVAIQAVQPVVESRASQVILRAANDSEASLLSTMKEIFKIRADNPCAELYLVELICRAWRQLSDVITEQEEGRVEAKGDAQGTAAVRERNVKRMLAFIHAHYSEPIGVDDIAQSTAISRTECFRCFRSVLNSTPNRTPPVCCCNASSKFKSNRSRHSQKLWIYQLKLLWKTIPCALRKNPRSIPRK